MTTLACPCGGENLTTCCGPFLSGKADPATAEQLMRSRYSAFALGNVDYIINSHHPETRDEVERQEIEVWSKESEWHALSVLRVEAGGEQDEQGLVDFVARYTLKGLTTEHRERALFERHEGKWVFRDGGEIPKEKKALEPKKWVPKGKKNKKRKK